MNITKVGIGVALFNHENKVLLGKRKGSHGEGEYAFPGGHLEYMESFDATARRELAEEIGPHVVFDNLEVVSIINLVEYAPKHYIDIGMSAQWVSGKPQVMEPDKVESWSWYTYKEVFHLPTFSTVKRILEAKIMSKQWGVQVYDKGDE